MYRNIKNLLASLTLLSFMGCVVYPPVYLGSPIDGMNKLGQLKQDITTKQDVRNMMGAPSGYGKMRLKPDSELLDTWLYQYIVQKGEQANINMMIIFIDKNGIYKGHVAFISDTLAEDAINPSTLMLRIQ
jgi:hypothetical protein